MRDNYYPANYYDLNNRKDNEVSIKSTLNIIDEIYFKKYIANIRPYGFKSLVLCVIDSVFSISAVYSSTIRTLDDFVDHAGIKDKHKDEYTCEAFLNCYGNLSGEELANNVFRNRQRTSTVNGILKAQAVKEYIQTFFKNEINTTKDLLSLQDETPIKTQIQRIKGQGSGITFHYVMMLAGDSNRYKRDRQIDEFFQDILGYGKLTNAELTEAFREQLRIVNEKYPEIDNIRGLDSIIWGYMSERTARQKQIDKCK